MPSLGIVNPTGGVTLCKFQRGLDVGGCNRPVGPSLYIVMLDLNAYIGLCLHVCRSHVITSCL